MANLDYLRSPKPLSGGGFLRGAHHPHCERYYNHLIWIAGHPLCLGCTCMYTGIVVGVPLVFAISWSSLTVGNWILLHLMLLIPTILQIRIQIKVFKIVSRFILGVNISLYLIGGLIFVQPSMDRWFFRTSVLVAFLIVYRLIRQLRNRYTKQPCDDCPLGYFPTCEWNLPRLLAENTDTEFLGYLSSDTIENLVIKQRRS